MELDWEVDRLISPSEAREKLGISQSTWHRKVRPNVHIVCGRVSVDSLNDFIASQAPGAKHTCALGLARAIRLWILESKSKGWERLENLSGVARARLQAIEAGSDPTRRESERLVAALKLQEIDFFRLGRIAQGISGAIDAV